MDLYQTERLTLRRWQRRDQAPFAELNADPDVVEFLPKPLAREESDTLISSFEAHFEKHGFGRWAIEEKATGQLIGFVGLSVPNFKADFMPCVEIAWRLARGSWGRGYATEAAKKALRIGFEEFSLSEIVSFTVPANIRSRSVMEKIGMRQDVAGSFKHPVLPEGHRLQDHVLYRLIVDYWRAQ